MRIRRPSSFVAVIALLFAAAWFAMVPLIAQVSVVQVFARAAFQATSHYIIGSANTSGVRLDVESGFLACREGDDSAYCDGIRALIYQARRDGIGTTSTDGVRLMNSTAAAAGAQQYSPRTCWEGQGWKTDATAASQSVVFCMETQPVQGSSAPTGNFILKASINGGAFSTVATFNSAGQLLLPDGSAGAPGFLFTDVGLYRPGANRLSISTNGTEQARFGGNLLDLGTRELWWGSAFGTSDLKLARAVTGTLGLEHSVKYSGIAFSSLGTPSNGTVTYCTDCAADSNPCTGSSTGAIAKRLNGAWDCR